jgi:hypothetical protein
MSQNTRGVLTLVDLRAVVLVRRGGRRFNATRRLYGRRSSKLQAVPGIQTVDPSAAAVPLIVLAV